MDGRSIRGRGGPMKFKMTRPVNHWETYRWTSSGDGSKNNVKPRSSKAPSFREIASQSLQITQIRDVVRNSCGTRIVLPVFVWKESMETDPYHPSLRAPSSVSVTAISNRAAD